MPFRQDIGIHTKLGVSRYESKAERELHKRVFWCLVYIGESMTWDEQ